MADSENIRSEHGIPLLDVEAQREADGEKQFLAEPVGASPSPSPAVSAGARRKFLTWTAINMLATIGIVFTNKAIFDDPDFKLMQTSFASFHFICTGLTLWVVSRPRFGAFVPKRAGVVEMLPVSHASRFAKKKRKKKKSRKKKDKKKRKERKKKFKRERGFKRMHLNIASPL